MTSDSNSGLISRRTALKSGGLIAGGVVVGSLLSSPVAATADMTFDLEGSEAESRDGRLGYVATGLQGYIQWENFSTAVEVFDLRDQVSSERTSSWFTIQDIENRDVDNEFGRAWDRSDSGYGGHISFHVPDPNGAFWAHTEDGNSNNEFSSTPTRRDEETMDNTWIIMRDDDRLTELEDGDTLPYAVNPDYGLPSDPVDLVEDTNLIYVPDEGDESTTEVQYRRHFTLKDADENVLETVEETETFDITVTQLEDETTVEVRGQTAADGP